MSPQQPLWVWQVSFSLPEFHESPWVSWVSSSHESPAVSMSLCDSYESHECTVVCLRLMSLQKSQWVSWAPSRLSESHDTPIVSQIHMSPHEFHESPFVSRSLESTVVSLIFTSNEQSLWVFWVPSSFPETHASPLLSLSLMIPHEFVWFSRVLWVSSSLHESHEAQLDSLSLMSPQQPLWVSWVPRSL